MSLSKILLTPREAQRLIRKYRMLSMLFGFVFFSLQSVLVFLGLCQLLHVSPGVLMQNVMQIIQVTTRVVGKYSTIIVASALVYDFAMFFISFIATALFTAREELPPPEIPRGVKTMIFADMVVGMPLNMLALWCSLGLGATFLAMHFALYMAASWIDRVLYSICTNLSRRLREELSRSTGIVRSLYEHVYGPVEEESHSG